MARKRTESKQRHDTEDSVNGCIRTSSVREREVTEHGYRCEWCRVKLVSHFPLGTHYDQNHDCKREHIKKYGNAPGHNFKVATNKTGKYRPVKSRAGRVKREIGKQLIEELMFRSRPVTAQFLAARIEIGITPVRTSLKRLVKSGDVVQNSNGFILKR